MLNMWVKIINLFNKNFQQILNNSSIEKIGTFSKFDSLEPGRRLDVDIIQPDCAIELIQNYSIYIKNH